MERTQLLSQLAALSGEFGTSRYVHGGGGNTSVKENGILWIKPSGRTLAGLEPGDFIGLERASLADLYGPDLPAEPADREEAARRILAGAVLPGSTGRPSVETPLHDSIPARFVVHTHATLVNGLTCARGGREACARLFPDALFIDYCDPGCRLARRVREELARLGSGGAANGLVIFLQNHGVFVAADQPPLIRTAYDRIMKTLADHYRRHGLEVALADAPGTDTGSGTAAEPVFLTAGDPIPASLSELLPQSTAAAFAGQAERLFAAWPTDNPLHLAIGTGSGTVGGPLTPDHIVYAGTEPFAGPPTTEAVAAWRRRFGYDPKVIILAGVTCGAGSTPDRAALALEVARDAVEIVRLADTFGGVRYLDRDATRFIEGWEVERYRNRQI